MAFEPVIKNGFPLIIERGGALVPAVDDAPDCDTCCPESGEWDWYHEYADAGYTPPSVINTENLARTAAVYREDPVTDIDSYPDWFVVVTDPGFSTKSIDESLAPLGVISQEIVFYHIRDSGLLAWTGVQAQSRTILWHKDDADWAPDPEIGAGTRVAFVGTLSSIDYDEQIPKHSEAAGGLSAWSGGIVRWEYSELDDEFRMWRLPAQTYEVVLDPPGWGSISSFAIPVYTYSGIDFNNIWDIEGTGNIRDFVTYFMPIASAPQSNLAIGARRGFMLSLPETHTEFLATNDYTATIEFNIGPVEIDEDGYAFVNGSKIWEFAAPHYHHSSSEGAGISSGSIEAQLDTYDARDAETGGSIAIFTYKYTTSFLEDLSGPDPEYVSDAIDVYTVLVINGGEISNRLMVRVTDIQDTPTYELDRRSFWPQWFAPRCLHTSELAQGSGTRAVVFERVPLNPGDALQYNSSTTIGNYRLRCYHDASLEYSITSRWGRQSQASGVLTTQTTTQNVNLDIQVVPGGCADRENINNGMELQIFDETPEDAIYDQGSRRLTVHIDISGGNNTVADLIDVINAAGDFQITGFSPFDGDTKIIQDASGGFGGMNGASDNPGSSSTPFVNDSSNRYYYIHNFPMRVRELVNNRWTCYFIQGTFSYPRTWMISHNGEVKIPCGIGENNWDRAAAGATHPVSGNLSSSYCCIKNSNLIPLCPPLFDENQHDTCDIIPQGEPPTVIITVAPPNGPDTTATIVWVTTGVITLQRVQLDGAALTPYVGNSITYQNLQPTDPSFHTFLVRVENEFGFDFDNCQWQQGGTPPAAPTVTITQAPDDPTTNTSATFAWTTTGTISSTVCRLDGVDSNCSSPVTYTDLEPGEHEFRVTVANSGGSDFDTHTWEVEEPAPGAPTVTITIKPPSQSTNNDVTFEWTTTGTIDSTTCQLSPGATGACTSPKNYNDLTPGTYTFRVTVANGSGSDFDEWTFEILEEAPPAPTVTITTAPDDPTDNPNATFDWTTTGFVENTVCELDGVETDPCSKPKSYEGLADGDHTFRVTVSNDGGSNFDEHEWTVAATNCSKLRQILRVVGTTCNVDFEIEFSGVVQSGCAGGSGFNQTFLFPGPHPLTNGNSSCTAPMRVLVVEDDFIICSVGDESTDIAFSICDFCISGTPGFGLDTTYRRRQGGNNVSLYSAHFEEIGSLAEDLIDDLLATGECVIPFHSLNANPFGTPSFDFSSAVVTLRVFPI